MLLIVALTVANAQEPDEGCEGTTYDVSVCLAQKYKRVDSELNAAYQRALKSAKGYDDKDIQNLKDAERKWIGYRDAACKAEYNLWGRGSGGPNAHTICLIRLARERATHLKDAYYHFSN